jgi:asparagine synthase (glutamine-hydrolysing)
MCGLVIAVARDGQTDTVRLAAAARALDHRGPDARGQRVVRLGPGLPAVGMAHTRLAITDRDPRADQPFGTADHLLAYNGEVYNHAALGRSMPLVTPSDTEVLFNLMVRDGADALARCNGMWALGFLDVPRRRLVLARDRYGKKPLFYLARQDRFLVASELRALLLLAGQLPVARAAAVDSFVAGGWLMPDADGATHLLGVRQVRPGYALELDLAEWRWAERRVATLDCGDPAAPPGDGELPALLADAVRCRLMGQRRIGLMLSGGVDSTLILSILAALDRLDDVVCMTGEAGKSDDAAEARAAARAVGATTEEVAPDYAAAGLAGFLDACRVQEKPFPLIGNVLGLHVLYRAMARHGVAVVLDGAGADEVFGGYWNRYAGFAMRAALQRNDRVWLDGVAGGGALPGRYAQLAADSPPACFAPSAEELPEADLAILSTGGRATVAAAAPADPLVGFGGPLHDALCRDATGGRMQEWLWHNDRNAMAASIENRSPFLDWRLARWMAQGYADKFHGGFNKPALRRAFAHFRPMPSASRAGKQGFRWVYGRFMRHNAAQLAALLRGSRIVGRYVDARSYAGTVQREPETLMRPLAHRLVVLAGLEHVGALADAA